MRVLNDSMAKSLWNQSADAWEHFVESGLDYYRTELHGPALLEACGDVRDRDVLDLGCGQGWFTRQLAAHGARVIGVDWAPALVAHARRHEVTSPLGAIYEVLDALEIGCHFSPESFDLITGCMSLTDMPRPESVLAAARSLLRQGGGIVVSVPNPGNDTSYREWERDDAGRKLCLKIDRYFETTATVLEWNMGRLTHPFRTVQYRHTLEQWSRMFENTGLALRRLREPRPSDEAVAQRPELADAQRLPFFLIFDLRPA